MKEANKQAWIIMGKQMGKFMLYGLLCALAIAFVGWCSFRLHRAIEASEHAEIIFSMAPYCVAAMVLTIIPCIFLYNWKENIRKGLVIGGSRMTGTPKSQNL